MEKKRASLRLDGVTLHYTVAGQGTPLVLLHGLAGSSRWWDRNIPALARHFEVFTLDMAGFGRSRGQHFNLRAAADQVQGWLDAVGIGSCQLMGHSMGGYVVTALVTRTPRRFGRSVLVDALVLPLRSSLPAVTLRLLHALWYMPPDFLPVLVQDTWSAGPGTMVRAIRDSLQADLTGELAKIQTDLMIVWGENDKLIPLVLGLELNQRLAGAQLVVVPGAGHNPMWDRPQAFHQAVIPFLLGNKPSRVREP